jgi:hypothetical protein
LKSKATVPAEGDKSKPGADSKPDTKDDVSDDSLLAALENRKLMYRSTRLRFREVLAENRQLKGPTNDTVRSIRLSPTSATMRGAWVCRMMTLHNCSHGPDFAKDPTAAVEQLQAFTARQEKVGGLPAGPQTEDRRRTSGRRHGEGGQALRATTASKTRHETAESQRTRLRSEAAKSTIQSTRIRRS